MHRWTPTHPARLIARSGPEACRCAAKMGSSTASPALSDTNCRAPTRHRAPALILQKVPYLGLVAHTAQKQSAPTVKVFRQALERAGRIERGGPERSAGLQVRAG